MHERKLRLLFYFCFRDVEGPDRPGSCFCMSPRVPASRRPPRMKVTGSVFSISPGVPQTNAPTALLGFPPRRARETCGELPLAQVAEIQCRA